MIIIRSNLKVLILCEIIFISISGVISEWITETPFYGQNYAKVLEPRGLLVDPVGNLLVLSRNTSSIQLIYEKQVSHNGRINAIQIQLINGTGLDLNHALAYHKGYLYASSNTSVYRWPYSPGRIKPVTSSPEIVISNVPGVGHITRTLIFDSRDRLYISIGSQKNVETENVQAKIVRFNFKHLSSFPVPYSKREIFADGVRNEVGLAFDLTGVLHGVENSADELSRVDLGGDIHNGNPAEELNRFDKPVGTHYGYPYCFSSYDLKGYEAGTQFAWPDFMNDGIHSDAWCRDSRNNQPPLLPMPAHYAPLGIDFYRGRLYSFDGAFPYNMRGNAVIAFHGSWNSDKPVGYKVSMYTFKDGNPTGESIDVIREKHVETCETVACFRPVNAVFSNQGHLFVSSDNTDEIVKVTYGKPPKPISGN